MPTRLVLRHFPDAGSLLAVASGFLSATAGASNLTTGILGSLRVDPSPPEGLYLAAVGHGSADAGPGIKVEPAGIRLVVVRTPPLNLVLSACDEPAAVGLLLDELIASGAELPGVIGPRDVAGRFALGWAERTGQTARLVRHERSHRLDRLIPIPPERIPRGRARPAGAADRALVAAWLDAFHVEAVPDDPRRETESDARRWLTLAGRTLWLWEVEGRVVSFAGLNRTGGSIARIGPVYTPPEERGRGYAAAVTSAATAAGIADGADCYLFTDLANSTSNAIYARLGFMGVADIDEWRFDRPSGSPRGDRGEAEVAEAHAGSDPPAPAPDERARLAVVGAWAERLADPGFALGAWAGGGIGPDGIITMPWYRLSAEAEEFLRDLGTSGWLQPFDWMAWLESPEARRLREEPGAIEAAGPDDLRQLLTAIVRGERFGDGNIAGAHESGLLARICQRAAVLAAGAPAR